VLSLYTAGDHVLVDTERGREIGLVVDGALQVTPKQLKEIKEPLKPVIRVLSEQDYERIDELDAKGREAMPVFRELIAKHNLDMKPVSVDFLFTGDKAVFYFSNDDRVDFRELVRDLASRFHIRVDMRQIGVRDEARILGGLAHCGEELCCTRLSGEFQPVSIRMAKEQDLPLNPTKISGACGRLMCCLRYEFEAYKDFKGRAPKKGAIIETPIGQAKVIDFDTPREIIMLRLEDGKQLAIPLKEFECEKDKDGKEHPCRVSRDAIDRCAPSSILMALAALEQETAAVAAEVDTQAEKRGHGGSGDQPIRRLRRAKNRGNNSSGGDKQPGKDKQQDGKNAKKADGERSGKARSSETTKDKKKSEADVARKRTTQKPKPRPGQHSSGIRSADNAGNLGRSDQPSGGLGNLRRRRRPTNKPNQ
jgi:cell fate regulator YaaT (PSP1 superfamily)